MKKYIGLLVILFGLSTSIVKAHGGEDHGESGTMPQSISGDVLTVTSYPGRYEVFLKYGIPEVGKPVTAKLFFADYATNHPVNPERVDLSFPGTSGARVIAQAQKVSDGIYALTLQFDRDTNYTALLKFIHNSEEQITALSPFYAGTAAKKVIASANTSQASSSTNTSSSFSYWLLIPLIVILGIACWLFWTRRKTRRVTTTQIEKVEVKKEEIG